MALVGRVVSDPHVDVDAGVPFGEPAEVPLEQGGFHAQRTGRERHAWDRIPRASGRGRDDESGRSTPKPVCCTAVRPGT